MPRLHNVPPSAVHADIESLQQPLKGAVPSKRLDENLLVASWNIRGFASLTRKWTAGDADSPKQDLRGLLAIGEIIRRFDVIAAVDFDIDRKNNPLWQAFTSKGLTVAEDWRAHPDPYLPIRSLSAMGRVRFLADSIGPTPPIREHAKTGSFTHPEVFLYIFCAVRFGVGPNRKDAGWSMCNVFVVGDFSSCTKLLPSLRRPCW